MKTTSRPDWTSIVRGTAYHRGFCGVLAIVVALGVCGFFSRSLSAAEPSAGEDHWAFRPLKSTAVPHVSRPERVQSPVDAFLIASWQHSGLDFQPPADRATWLRRITLDLIGRPPTLAELEAFHSDRFPAAMVNVVERLLGSPQYGERWGKYWLDTAGYADSNGYFNADSNRPLAWQYRDYVIRAFNADKPFDQFVREQLAGDELAGGPKGAETVASLSAAEVDRLRELFVATHFLRNAQDGTSESDGNPDEVTVDRATVLEGALQLTVNSLFGLTIQCARCHEHKFEPIAHREYYALQAVFYPAFPAFHPDKWVKPNDRVGFLATADETLAWENDQQRIQRGETALRDEFRDWQRQHRPPGEVLFVDRFDGEHADLNEHWSNVAPGDDAPAGMPPVQLNAATAPGAVVQQQALHIVESGDAGDRWLCTRRQFDWTPARPREWVQVTFDLLQERHLPEGKPAERIAFCLAAHDFHDRRETPGGNVLIDGNPAGGAAVHLDYPGADSKHAGTIGTSGYRPSHNYGVRITRRDDGQFQLEQLVDGLAEEKPITLTAAQLPDGAFAFEYCCGRSFVVDNVLIERSPQDDAGRAQWTEFERLSGERRQTFDAAVKALQDQRRERPGKYAGVMDRFAESPEVFVLERGAYGSHGEKVEPALFRVLTDANTVIVPKDPAATSGSTGRRLVFAQRITGGDRRATALVARVLVNRVWQQHFGTGLVSTPDNFGLSGQPPSHPELLEFLAHEFVQNGWSIKALHRLIVLSTVYQQATASDEPPTTDPDNLLLSRFPLRRLDAEALRDAMLSVTDELETTLYGSYVPTSRQGDGDVTVDENRSDARRRGVYLQQRRSQVNSWLALFDAPALVTNCSMRNTTTVPLQSLALLNSHFMRHRSAGFAGRLQREATDDASRIERAFLLAIGRSPRPVEATASQEFLAQQRFEYADQPDAETRVWNDFCQMVLASNAFLYVE
jgi:hypothetical protein